MNKNPVSLSINPTGCVDGKGGKWGGKNSLKAESQVDIQQIF